MRSIHKYFPALSDHQIDQFEQLFKLYADWNTKINVISRKDIDQLYTRHVLHSLSIVKYIQFKNNSRIIDLGTGGGFPGIPLAIYFPNVEFHLVDSVAKKLKVIDDIASTINLKNIETSHIRIEQLKDKCDFIVSRAVKKLPQLMEWSRNLYRKNMNHGLPNGLIALKGGDLTEELKSLGKKAYYEKIPIADYFQEEFFNEKYLVYVQG